MQEFVMIRNVGIMINADINPNNWLTKEHEINDLFGILVIVNINVINHVMLENIEVMKIVNVERLTNWKSSWRIYWRY